MDHIGETEEFPKTQLIYNGGFRIHLAKIDAMEKLQPSTDNPDPSKSNALQQADSAEHKMRKLELFLSFAAIIISTFTALWVYHGETVSSRAQREFELRVENFKKIEPALLDMYGYCMVIGNASGKSARDIITSCLEADMFQHTTAKAYSVEFQKRFRAFCETIFEHRGATAKEDYALKTFIQDDSVPNRRTENTLYFVDGKNNGIDNRANIKQAFEALIDQMAKELELAN